MPLKPDFINVAKILSCTDGNANKNAVKSTKYRPHLKQKSSRKKMLQERENAHAKQNTIHHKDSCGAGLKKF